jgi:hypothetical protein
MPGQGVGAVAAAAILPGVRAPHERGRRRHDRHVGGCRSPSGASFEDVKDLAAGSGLTFEDRGEHELKGVPDRSHLYRVVAEGA